MCAVASFSKFDWHLTFGFGSIAMIISSIVRAINEAERRSDVKRQREKDLNEVLGKSSGSGGSYDYAPGGKR